jgi:hypothetical protein
MIAASSLVRTRAGRIRFSVVLLAINVACAVVAVVAIDSEHEPPGRIAVAWLIMLVAVGVLRCGWNLTYRLHADRRLEALEWISLFGTFAVGLVVLLFAGSLVVDAWGGTGIVDYRKFGAVVIGERKAEVHHLLGNPLHHDVHRGSASNASRDCDAYELLPMEAWGAICYANGRVISTDPWSETP